MTTATAIKLAISKDAKPQQLLETVQLLTHGAGDKKREGSSESEYLDEQWWTSEGDESDDLDGVRGDNP
jgi:hypothetical protein